MGWRVVGDKGWRGRLGVLPGSGWVARARLQSGLQWLATRLDAIRRRPHCAREPVGGLYGTARRRDAREPAGLAGLHLLGLD